MLVIRNEQMRAIEALRLQEFEGQACAHLRKSFPTQCESLGQDGVAAFVRYGVDRARAIGFESEFDILRFLNLVMVFGYEVEQQDWVREILDHEGYEPCTKMDLLTETGMLREEGALDEA
jgi:hypothetical protein